MPQLNAGRVHPRSTARRRPGGRATQLALAVVVLIAGGCIAQDALPSQVRRETAPPPATTSAPAASPSIVAAGPSGSLAAAATPIPDLVPVDVPIATVTVICEAWAGDPPPVAIDCGDAAALGLAALGGEQAASVRRLDVHIGALCGSAVCPERRADAGWVVARSASFDSLVVRLEIDASGVLQAWPPVQGPVQTDPSFGAPARTAPDIDASAPAELRDREALPFCGEETMADPDAFDRAVRTCFLDGILAGVPVELVSRAPTTEGHWITTVYRYLGRGAIVRYIGTDRWVVSACGIEPIDTPAVFLMAGPCAQRDP